jgi:chitodextrinase
MLLALTSLSSAPPASAAPVDRQAPSTPTNLRITGNTSYTVSLAWSPSSDNSGSFSYRVHHSSGYEATVPQSQTSFTWTGNLEPRSTYSFYVYAIDAAGNKSKNSNSVTIRLPADTIPPSKPVLTVTDVGPTHVALAWSATDDGPRLWYSLYKNGSGILFQTSATSATVGALQPSTTYVFTVRAQDFGGNWSPLSDAVTVTTPAPDPNDHSPPTMPGNLTDNGMSFQDGETWLFWQQSTDNVTPQSAIEYRVYVNGVYDHSVVGDGRTILYGAPFVSNTFHVIAVDGAGNQSAAATFTSHP